MSSTIPKTSVLNIVDCQFQNSNVCGKGFLEIIETILIRSPPVVTKRIHTELIFSVR